MATKVNSKPKLLFRVERYTGSRWELVKETLAVSEAKAKSNVWYTNIRPNYTKKEMEDAKHVLHELMRAVPAMQQRPRRRSIRRRAHNNPNQRQLAFAAA